MTSLRMNYMFVLLWTESPQQMPIIGLIFPSLNVMFEELWSR